MNKKIILLMMLSVNMVFGIDMNDVIKFESRVIDTEKSLNNFSSNRVSLLKNETLYSAMKKYNSSEARAIANWAKVLYETRDRVFYEKTLMQVKILLQKMLFDKVNPMNIDEYKQIKQMLSISKNYLESKEMKPSRCRTNTDLNVRYLPFYTRDINTLTKVMTLKKSTLLDINHMIEYSEGNTISKWGYISDIEGNKGWINLQYCE